MRVGRLKHNPENDRYGIWWDMLLTHIADLQATYLDEAGEAGKG